MLREGSGDNPGIVAVRLESGLSQSIPSLQRGISFFFPIPLSRQAQESNQTKTCDNSAWTSAYPLQPLRVKPRRDPLIRIYFKSIPNLYRSKFTPASRAFNPHPAGGPL